jgi:proteasome beta subunit
VIPSLPSFTPDNDPGPNFAALLGAAEMPASAALGASTTDIPHGTTCVAIRFADGVVLAGDRRATSGHQISHRTIEKVFEADRHSGIAIAGAAGPAIEMVKLFQLQLEHYEKVEGKALSLEGKANQLSQMVRGNLPAAMQGLAVVPLFAGFDLRRARGRLFQFDITGGRYEERLFATTGSGGMHATTVIKLGYNEGQSRGDAAALAANALFEAADEDAATGGPDLIREVYPIIATITAEGFERLGQEEVAGLFGDIMAERRRLRGDSNEATSS